MTVERIVNRLERDERFQNRVEHVEVLPGNPPVHGELEGLPEPVQTYLQKKGIILYTHQCDAIKKLRAGKNVIITTPTASGKTLAFNIPVFERMYDNKSVRALYLYPTKAMATRSPYLLTVRLNTWGTVSRFILELTPIYRHL